MKNLKNLIEDLKNEAKSEWAIAEDMADMYEQDAKDAENALNLLSKDWIEAAATHITYLDTCIRERIVMAIYADKGAEFTATLGWEVN